jgi:uncharacterized protein YjgD (DUF1641 family)
MATAVSFREFTPQNSRDDLRRKLEEAPDAHIEAILSAYDLLQATHDKGLLDLAKGALSAGGTLVDRATDVISSKPAVTGLRLALILSNLLAVLDADRIHALLTPSATNPPSLLTIGRRMMSSDARRGLAVAAGFLNVLGAALTLHASVQGVSKGTEAGPDR